MSDALPCPICGAPTGISHAIAVPCRDPDHRFTTTGQRRVTLQYHHSTLPSSHSHLRNPRSPATGNVALPAAAPEAGRRRLPPRLLPRHRPIPPAPPPHAPLPFLPPRAPPLRRPPPTLGPHPHLISPRLSVARLHAPGGRGLLRRRRQRHRALLAAVSGPYLPFLSNWLISVRRAGRADQVLVIAEDYETLDRINAAWPGHAVLVPPAPDAQDAHKFGSQGFFNFTSRRPRHLLQILELGYSVIYNDVDMVWLADPFPYLVGDHEVYIMDHMTPVKPLDHSHELPPTGKERTDIYFQLHDLPPANGRCQAVVKEVDRGAEGAAMVEAEEVK
ncbi:hypothetical protein C2845_PM11G24320 [Panicum miliaceum]|uniref:Nucleotide-diphospho-sugar transferase domain-containing protein n=1 Tax=Panicum miliaceum TaxID=4540 RepID=A0A3L6RT47_PANMI|nr:hypothetical protein C2845_PM11G24320 [Panicum miliaceum]